MMRPGTLRIASCVPTPSGRAAVVWYPDGRCAGTYSGTDQVAPTLTRSATDAERPVAEGNPAERLHRVMDAFSRRPDGVTLADVLAQLCEYEVEVDDDNQVPDRTLTQAELLQMFGALVALPADIRVALGRLPRDQEDVEHLGEPAGARGDGSPALWPSRRMEAVQGSR